MSDDNKFLGPNIHPGAKIAVQVGDDEFIEDTVHSVYYRDARPEVLKRRPTGWRKVLRQLTPPRFRKPLPVVRPYQPAQTEVIMTGEHGRAGCSACRKTSTRS